MWPDSSFTPYFLYASSEGSGEPAHCLSKRCSPMRKVSKSHVLAHFI